MVEKEKEPMSANAVNGPWSTSIYYWGDNGSDNGNNMKMMMMTIMMMIMVMMNLTLVIISLRASADRF